MASRYWVLFYVFGITGAFAQPAAQDLLLQKANNERVDSTKVLLWNEYVSSIRETDNASALNYAEQAKELAQQISFKKGLGLALENIGWIYYRKGNYAQSLEASTEALKINTEIKNYKAIGHSLNNIAAVHYEQKQYEEAISKFKEALKLGEKFNFLEIQSRSMNNISLSYLALHRLDSARKYALKSIEISKKDNDLLRGGFGNRILGDIYFEEGNYDLALHYFNECLNDAKEKNNNFLITSTLHRLAKTNFAMGNSALAIQQLKRNVELSQRLGYKNELERSYKLLSEIFQATGNIAKAYENQSLYVQLHDSLYSQRSAEQILLNQVRFESDIKQAKINLLTKDALLREKEIDSQRKLIYIFLISFSVVIGLVIVLVSANRRVVRINKELASKNEQINLQAKELGSLNATKDKLFSIIGHDLRSPVASLRGLLDLVNTSHLSQQEFITFSKNLKNNLDYIHDDLNNLLNWARTQLNGFEAIPEYNSLYDLVEEKINLFSETARGKGISLINKVPGAIEVFSDKNHLSLILRNLIGNAIKFNNPGGNTEVMAHIDGDNVEIMITDSGRGMSVEEIGKLFHIGTHFTRPGTQNEKGMGIGLLLVKEFVEKNGGSISVKSEIGKGTTFTVTMKARKKQLQFV